MEPLRTYDYLVRARRRVFDWVRPLGAQDYSRQLPTWRKTLGQVLTHTMTSEWYYIQRLQGHDVPPDTEWLIREEEPPPFPVLEHAWNEQAVHSRAALTAVRDWGARIEYRVTLDDGVPLIVTATATDIFTQLVLHEMHHRAQAMNMLQILGVDVEDIDFNTMTYGRRPVDGGRDGVKE